MRPVTVNLGPFAAASATNIRTASAIAGAGAVTLNGSTVVGGVATLDVARKIIFTSSGNDTGITFTITGTDGANNRVTEVLTGANAAAAISVMDYKTVTSVVASGAAAGTVSIGTQASGGVASTPWVRFDDWAPGTADIQTTVTGTINYSVQFTSDDPNSPTNPVAPSAMSWLATPDAALTGASTSLRSVVTVVPAWARVLVNSYTGAGAVSATFRQLGTPPQ